MSKPNDNPPQQPPEEKSDFAYFKSVALPGLSVQIGDSPTGQQDQPQHVQFTPYMFFDEERGDHYRVGFLATDEQDAIEVLSEDPNVIQIDEAEYTEVTENNSRAKL